MTVSANGFFFGGYYPKCRKGKYNMKKNVLIVEDDPMARKLFEIILKKTVSVIILKPLLKVHRWQNFIV